MSYSAPAFAHPIIPLLCHSWRVLAASLISARAAIVRFSTPFALHTVVCLSPAKHQNARHWLKRSRRGKRWAGVKMKQVLSSYNKGWVRMKHRSLEMTNPVIMKCAPIYWCDLLLFRGVCKCRLVCWKKKILNAYNCSGFAVWLFFVYYLFFITNLLWSWIIYICQQKSRSRPLQRLSLPRHRDIWCCKQPYYQTPCIFSIVCFLTVHLVCVLASIWFV